MKFKIYLYFEAILNLEEGVWRAARPMKGQKTAKRKVKIESGRDKNHRSNLRQKSSDEFNNTRKQE